VLRMLSVFRITHRSSVQKSLAESAEMIQALSTMINHDAGWSGPPVRTSSRLDSVGLLRGWSWSLMALDHTRGS